MGVTPKAFGGRGIQGISLARSEYTQKAAVALEIVVRSLRVLKKKEKKSAHYLQNFQALAAYMRVEGVDETRKELIVVRLLKIMGNMFSFIISHHYIFRVSSLV